MNIQFVSAFKTTDKRKPIETLGIIILFYLEMRIFLIIQSLYLGYCHEPFKINSA